MSKIIIQSPDGQICAGSKIQAEIGYDNGLQTFYARIYWQESVEAFIGTQAIEADTELLWVGTNPREITTAKQLAEIIGDHLKLNSSTISRLQADQQREYRPPTALQKEMFNLIGAWNQGADTDGSNLPNI